MGLGRRKVRLGDASAWVFNRMAEVYSARPAYPRALIQALVQGSTPCVPAGHGSPLLRVLDLGAGTGHLSLPLASAGCQVVAVEPARAMLDVLEANAAAQGTPGLALRTLHATAEALPLAEHSVDLAVVADALHFLDAELAGREVSRVLSPGGALAVVTCSLGDTPFMRGVVRTMEEAAPRRPRDMAGTSVQFFRTAGVTQTTETSFEDETPVDEAQLLRILRSISFIGPAMNAERFDEFSQSILGLPQPRIWARRFSLRLGRRAL
jgi:ubiquinone/menaquinone biosynthesis C-methylase UbiE